MSEKQQYELDEKMDQSNMLNNMGYRPSYDKTNEIKSSYFEQNSSNNRNDATIFSVGISVPSDVADVEQWILDKVCETGYKSWEEITPYLLLPDQDANVIDCINGAVDENHRRPFDLIRDAVVLSKCNQVRYNPNSPMIFSHKRINRAISLLIFDLKSFYELD